ncbi:MAG: hypothetical protein ACLRTD_25370 [Bacteroides sp.]
MEIFKEIAQTIDDAVITEYENNQPLHAAITLYLNLFKMNCQENVLIAEKDYTKYSLNGVGSYGKGRLALEVVRLFIESTSVDYKELINLLPKHLVKTVEEVGNWNLKRQIRIKDGLKKIFLCLMMV